MLGKNTILKAIHNSVITSPFIDVVWMLGKNTILKAIHNRNLIQDMSDQGVNAG